MKNSTLKILQCRCLKSFGGGLDAKREVWVKKSADGEGSRLLKGREFEISSTLQSGHYLEIR